MISVVCVFNRPGVFRDCLLASLENQTVSYQGIFLDNSANEFKSAACALNKGGDAATGEYILFIHQDMRFNQNTWLADAERILSSLENVGVAGLAGRGGFEGIVTNIDHGTPPQPAGNTNIRRATRVQTVDECAVIVPKSVFRNLRFDEVVCDKWHLYAVDYCLRVIELGMHVYVLPLHAYHRSHPGHLDEDYYASLAKVMEKHGKNHEWIHTTCGSWNTRTGPPSANRCALVRLIDAALRKRIR